MWKEAEIRWGEEKRSTEAFVKEFGDEILPFSELDACTIKDEVQCPKTALFRELLTDVGQPWKRGGRKRREKERHKQLLQRLRDT